MLVDLVIARANDPSADSSEVMKWAEQHGFDKIVKELLAAQLQEKPENPLQFVIGWVSRNGHAPLWKLLLSDKRIDPSGSKQFPIIFASLYGYTEIVQLLLADSRVDPSASDQLPLGYACRRGHVEVVKVLLADQRVDPSVQDQQAIRMATLKGHTEVVRLLLADQRVNPTGLDLSCSPELALCLLRRSFRLEISKQLSPQLRDFQSILLAFIAEIEKIDSQRKALLDNYLPSDLSLLCLDYVPDLFCHLTDISSLLDPSKDRSDQLLQFSFAHLSTL
jgi:ankyrin repeat protein